MEIRGAERQRGGCRERREGRKKPARVNGGNECQQRKGEWDP